MDYNFWQSFGLLIGVFFVEECCGYPLKSLEAGAAASRPVLMAAPLLLSAALFVVMVMLLVGCLCCRQTKGFQEFTDAVSTLDVSAPRAAPIPFPPLPPSEPVHFEPLPDIRPRRHAGLKPAPFAAPPPQASPAHWFAGASFPRQRLHYERELGGGWFGRVVAGRAQGLGAVVVKILREEAPAHEQRLFLQQAQPYRDLRHENVLRLLGCCLEAQPLLVLLEDCARGDLKSCLRDDPAFPESGGTLRLTCDVARGLEHMLDNGFVHTDLAARNCLVTSDLRVKVGDYGNGLDRFEQDYYVAGDVAVPIRWCAPETLDCNDTTIHTKQVSAASNVWSLGVVLWEVAERGRLPYDWLTDDEVVGGVVGGDTRLPAPSNRATPNADSLYQLMTRCWLIESDRPSIGQVARMLDVLAAGAVDVDDFQRRCETLASAQVTSASAGLFPPHQSSQEQMELQERAPMDEIEALAASERADLRSGARSPSTASPQPSMESFDFVAAAAARSDSLANLRGSVDELDAACVDNVTAAQPPATTSFDLRADAAVRSRDTAEFDSWLRCESTDGDSLFVREISAAIRDLDDALALEDSTETPRPRGQADFRLGRLEAAEEEMWRGRIERGEFSQKVKEKSRSVADLMVLTHIESDTSDSEVSMTWSFERNSNRTSFERGPLRTSLERGSVRVSKGSNKRSSLFGSEGDLRSAVLGEDFVESLQKIQVARRDSNKNLLSDVARFLREESQATDATDCGNARFLVIDASGETIGGSGVLDGESTKMPKCRRASDACDDDTRRRLTEDKLVRSTIESDIAVTKLAVVSEPSSVFVRIEENSRAPLKSVHLEDDNSVSLDEATLSEEPVTFMAPANHLPLTSDDGDDEPTSLTLRADTSSSETSLAAASLEDLEDASLSPVRRKPVPRPRRSTFGAIETQPRVAPRRRSLAAERLVEPGKEAALGGLCAGRLEGEESNVNTRLPSVEVHVNEMPVGKFATSDLIKVAEKLVDETILKSIESVGEIQSRLAKVKDGLTVAGVDVTRFEEKATYCTKAMEQPQGVVEEITKSINESECLPDPAVALPMLSLKTELPTAQAILETQQKSFPESSVILGPCDDFTLDFFKGLKTTYEDPASIHDWDSLVEESARAEPLMKDSDDDDAGEFGYEYFPSSLKDQAPEEPIDYSKLNGFAVKENVDQLVFTALNLSNDFNSKNSFLDIVPDNEGQLNIGFESTRATIDKPVKEVDVIDRMNVTNQFADAVPQIDSKIRGKGQISEWGIVPTGLDINEELPIQITLSDKLSYTDINSENNFVADISKMPEEFRLDGKIKFDETLVDATCDGFAEDMELDKELSDQPLKIMCKPEVANELSGKISDSEKSPETDWADSIEDMELDKELNDQPPKIECNSLPEVVDELKLKGMISGDEKLPNTDWTGSMEDMEMDQELDDRPPKIECKSVPEVVDELNLKGIIKDDEKLPNTDWAGSVEDMELDKELNEQPSKIDLTSEITAELKPERTFADDRRLPTADWNGFADDTEADRDMIDRLSCTSWYPESSDKSEDSNSSKPKADDSYAEWTSKESELKAEPFSDWDGKHEDDSKQATPDDERSSDSGFRDKGSLSESCEDEKYHLEDIEAELESFQRGGHDSDADADVVFGAEFKDCDGDVEPLDFTFLRERVDDDLMRDSLEGALPRIDSDPDRTLTDPDRTVTDLDATLTAEEDPLPVEIYEPGSGSGWFLHPPETSPERWGAPAGDTDFLAALRSELAEKLPNQSAPSDSESDSDCDEEPRRDVIIHYNAFQAPLSPILEEPWPDSPDAFFPRTFEQEVSAALDSLESAGSADGANSGSVRYEDLDGAARPVTVHATGRAAMEDVLMVDVVTNEARLLDSPVPPPHLAFASHRNGAGVDAIDATYAIRNEARSAISDSPGSDELSYRTADASPSRVVEISVGANDEAAMIVADLNESLASRSLFNTCSDDYSQVSHPSLDADSSDDYSQSEDSRELDLSPVRRLDLLTLSRPSADAWENSDAWERRMDGEEGWGDPARAAQIAALGDLLRSGREAVAVAVSPNAASEMKQFVNGHRMEVNGSELRMFKAGEECDWLDDIFNVGSPSQISGSSSASEYGISAEDEGLETERAVSDVKDMEILSETKESDFTVNAVEEKLAKVDISDEIGKHMKSAEKQGAKMAVREGVSGSTSLEEETEIGSVKRETSFEKEGADNESEAIVKSVKGSELRYIDTTDDKLVESELIKNKESENSFGEGELVPDVSGTTSPVKLHENKTSVQAIVPSSDSPKTENSYSEVTEVPKIKVSDANSSPIANENSEARVVSAKPAEVSANPAGADSPGDREGEIAEEWTSMLAFTPADDHLVEMSTSFSAGDGGDDDEYAPDWETDSSSSGEFTWQEGDTDYADDPRNSVVAGTAPYEVSSRKPFDCHSDFPMESIAEEDEDEDGSDGSDEDGNSDGSGEEFVPSAWDSEATPTRSALRSPDKVSEGKKNVTFKRQKYHCVYEYPRDVTETEPADSSQSDFGFSDTLQTSGHSFVNTNPVNYQNLSREIPISYANFANEKPVSYATFSKETALTYPGYPKAGSDFGGLSGLRAVDYSSYADWELNDGDGEDHDDEDEPEVAQRAPPTQFDFYKLGAEEFGAAGADDGEFFVSSSSRPFAAFAPSQFAPSQFFPGNCFEAPPSTGDTPPASPRSPSGLGELRHTRDRLKLHLPTDLPALAGIDGKRAAPDSDDSGVGSSNGAQTPATLQV